MRLTATMLTLVVCYKYASFCYLFALVPTAKYDINQILIFLFSCVFVVLNFLHIYQSDCCACCICSDWHAFFLLSGKCEN